MTNNLHIAALLSAAVALGHSVIGEWMIFRHLRRQGLVPADAGPGLREYQVRIIWASWHVLSFLGLAISALLWEAASVISTTRDMTLALQAACTAMAAGSALVGYATRLRHPAWFALLIISGLLYTGL